MKTLKPTITTRINAGGSLSYVVDAGIINGKRARKFFKTKVDADAHANELKNRRQRYGDLAFTLTAEQQVEAAEAFERLKPFSISLKIVVDEHRDNCNLRGDAHRN